MKKITSFLLLMIGWFVFSQKCNYQIFTNAENLKETGKFKLIIKNTDNKSFKIRKEISFCNMRLESLEFYNEETQSFEKINLANKDIDCFTYKDSDFTLKPSKIYTYEVNIKSDLAVMQSDKFFEAFDDRKYRFKISFPLDSYSQCGESNKVITDWIYKN
ncbi:hypothetical protein [Chryseobacterium sp.]|uniref:hypothetical protein n=1 Tax=Chryseobacterium sp. TaxID=1871047 RepID=UPI0028A0B730|nr:hypothetical protein [Chryseobacterium sp.]